MLSFNLVPNFFKNRQRTCDAQWSRKYHLVDSLVDYMSGGLLQLEEAKHTPWTSMPTLKETKFKPGFRTHFASYEGPSF